MWKFFFYKKKRCYYSVRSTTICRLRRCNAEVYRAPPLTWPSGQVRSNMDQVRVRVRVGLELVLGLDLTL